MPRIAPTALASLLLAACATPQGDYPSLAIRDAERVTGTLQPVEPAPLEPPAPATLANVEQLYLSAAKSHQAFLTQYRAAQPVALAARGAGEGSDRWAAASVAIAGAETERSRTMIALADLDRLYVAASTEGGALDELAEAQAKVAAFTEEEDAKIGELLAALGG